MSDGRKDVYEDEEDWHNFITKYNLQDTNWQVYSNEATWAKEAVAKKFVYPTSIKLYVRQKKEVKELNDKHNIEWKVLNEFTDLKL